MPFDQRTGRPLGAGAPPLRLVSHDDHVVRLAKLSEDLEHRRAPQESLEWEIGVATPFGRTTWVPLPITFGTGGAPVAELGGFVAASVPSWRALSEVVRAAARSAPILLSGESGTGKELLARIAHNASSRKQGQFVALNCAALPEALAEAELFGHARGAFTGATDSREGLLTRAHGGTLFLDELGELSPSLQSKLLRALEYGEVRPVGSNKCHSVNVRVVAATHRPLAAMVERGEFREDLYYRLSVFDIRVPPLRERSDELAVLAERLASRIDPPAMLSAAAHRELAAHPWPGNVRELRNALERAAMLADDGVILPCHLASLAESRGAGSMGPGNSSRLRALRDAQILDALNHHAGHRRQSYESLGISKSTLYRWLRAQRAAHYGHEAAEPAC
jgi:transcriptional regulator with PAS, ATPase and Fis domain